MITKLFVQFTQNRGCSWQQPLQFNSTMFMPACHSHGHLVRCSGTKSQQHTQQIHCHDVAVAAAACGTSRGGSLPRCCCRGGSLIPRASPYFTTDTVTQQAFQEAEYESTQQGQRRKAWNDAVRSATGRKHHLLWEPELDPPLLLDNVAVVLVGPKKPVSCGTIARSCSCFEVNDLRVVQPRCPPNTRNSRSVSKGAQWILYRSRQYDSLTEALADADLSVAMTRWLPDRPNSLPDLPSLLQQPLVQQLLQQPLRQAQQQQPPLPQAHHEQQQQQRPVRVALVYGREEFGLSDEEVAACDVACAIPIGRLQESLSLSHAVTVVLSQLFQARLTATAADPLASQYTVTEPAGLADGYDSSGTEH